MWTNFNRSCGRFARPTSRREFLTRAGAGFGLLALADLLTSPAAAAEITSVANPLAVRPPHFPAKAKSVVWLFMEGAPSAVDLFDPKPELDKNNGKKISIDTLNGNPGPLMKSPFKFAQYGRSGAWVCEKYQNVAKHIDDIAWGKACITQSHNPV